MNRDTVNKSVLLLLVIFISAVFLSMIKSFLMGMFIGPIVAALFVTILDIYGVAFKDILPETGSAPSKSRTNDNENPDQ